ncbi:MAG TPA: hypothetical protein PK625_00930 [Spirochaetales bacterium]|nr:hypothetical protein [Spirochaetales bacterium]
MSGKRNAAPAATAAPLLDGLAALGPKERAAVAGMLSALAGTFGELPDGRAARHTLGTLARLVAPPA